jgi:hypothetical protein
MKPSFTTRQAPRAAGPTVLHDGSRVSKKLGRKVVDWESDFRLLSNSTDRRRRGQIEDDVGIL